MIHFKKHIAYAKMDNVLQNFIYPKSLNDLNDENIVLIEDLFPFNQSKSCEKFLELRKEIIKMPIYVLKQKPTLVKRYLIATKHFCTYLRKVQKRENIQNNELINKLFLLDTIVDEENNKIAFTNYSIIALLFEYISNNKDLPISQFALDFLNDKEIEKTLCFYKDEKKYKLTRIYHDNYVFGIGVLSN